MKKINVLILACLGLVACTRFSTDSERVYALSQSGPPLIVPPPLSCENIATFYDLPPQTEDPHVCLLPPKACSHEEA